MSSGTTGFDTEVAVVGAGPAGLACAIALARQGLQVEVIDGMSPPIDKACGEGLTPDSLAALAALGFDSRNDFSTRDSSPLAGIRFIGNTRPGGRSITAEASFPQGPGRGIRRTVLHQLMLDRAAGLGVRFRWKTVVRGIACNEVHTNCQALRARYIVGADGHQSRIAALAGLERSSTSSHRIGLRQHYAIAPWTDFVEVYWSDRGQAYVTPVSSYEVCVAFIANRKFTSPEDALAHFPALGTHLAAAPPSDRPRGSITVCRRLRQVTAGNVALVGDASGSVDALTGEGLALGFRQALALAEALKSNNLALYQDAHRRIERLPRFMSRSMLLMHRSPLLRGKTFAALERNPALFSSLLQIHIGHSPLRLFGLDGVLSTGLKILTS